MAATAFISYSRSNRAFAKRLVVDLKRAGVDAWLDLSSLEPGTRWATEIMPAIAAAGHVVLLASPEAKESEWVGKELAEAKRLGKTVVPLRLAGLPGTMPADWEAWHMIEGAGTDYWKTFPRLVAAVKAPLPPPRSLVELLDSPHGTAADAAAELGEPAVEPGPNGRPFVKLPVAPSAYGMTWLFAPRDAPLRWPDSLGVLFNFTGPYSRARYQESLGHWAAEVGAADEPWLVMVEGPVNRADTFYEVNVDWPHEWDDAIHACWKVVEEFARRSHRVGYYLNCLTALAFEVAVRSKAVKERRRVYQYDQKAATARQKYAVAYDGWK